MTTEIILSLAPELQHAPLFAPTPMTAKRVQEFFTAQINNDNARKAFPRAAPPFPRRPAFAAHPRGQGSSMNARAFPLRSTQPGRAPLTRCERAAEESPLSLYEGNGGQCKAPSVIGADILGSAACLTTPKPNLSAITSSYSSALQCSLYALQIFRLL